MAKAQTLQDLLAGSLKSSGQYRTSGSLDDKISDDGDRGFTGVNQRMQLNQLQAGEVRESLNGRMDGFWKPRKSVEAKSTALTTGGSAMNLPFLIMPSPYYKAISAVSLNTAVDPDLVTITITSHGLPVGTSGNVTLSGITFTGTNYNGTVLMTVATVDTLTFPVASVTNVSLGATPRVTQLVINDSAASEVLASCLFSDPNDSNKEYVIVALETIAKKINLADYSITDLKYPSGETVTAPCDMIQSFDKVFIFRGGRQAMEYIPAGRAIRAASQSGTTVTVTIFDHGLKSGDLVTISGLSGTNPPNGVQAVVSVSSIDVFTFTVSTSQTASFVCTSAIAKCDFNMVPCGAYEQPLQFATSVGGFIINGNEVSVALNDTISVGSIITVMSASESSQTSGLTLGSRYTVSSVFLPSYSKTISGTPSHTAGTGIYTGLFKVTITTTVAHDLVIGQPITVSGNQANKVNGSRFVTGIVDSYTFEIHVDQSPSPSSGGSIVAADGFQFFINTNDVDSYVTTAESLLATPIFSKITSSGIGFSHMPAPPWAVSFQRRLWMPYYYNAGGTTASPTYTSRQITDEVIASDILDANTYDQIYNQFRITGGTSDYVVGLQPFFDDTLVVLNRNSIHAIKGAGGTLTDTSVVELTKEIGCLARKSVIMRGNTMLFLSDSGIYGLEFLNDYNLRGTEQPLSKLVQPYIDRINRRLAQDSVAVFFDNRYYIALPLDSTVGADDARGNNSILIYNFLNQGWESLDTYGNSGFKIKNFIIASAETRDRLYAVSANGGLHEIDSAESSVDRLSVSNTSDEVDTPSIDSSLTTRGYDLDTLDRKRFCDAQIQVQTLAGANGEYDISFASEDPDNAVPIGTTTQFLDGQLLSPSTSGEAETASIRCRLGGVRGYTGTLILRRTIGSPKIHSVKLTGTITNRQIISQK